ncbi:MAG: homoserine O-succinyltransferase [Xanthomonadales bacterium]|nr:homoserine O-succinyltransferase [Xanthomonadales bacterium]
MPLVEHLELPTFSRLREQGHEVMPLERAIHQDIRELHIGFLNMMPDAALGATERQFIRLVGSCNRIAQFYVYPFSLPGLQRSEETLAYIEKYYCDFEDLKAKGLDALIITGANVASPLLDQEPFWQPLMEVVRWADQNVASTLCSCLATHALLKQLYGIDRQPLQQKRWGVYDHRICVPGHPLLRGVNTRFNVPHSRHNDISRQQLEDAGLTVLVESGDGGVHMAVSPDQFRIIFFQGHPEYDLSSLLKEYKRELVRFLAGELDEAPPFPENYFSGQVCGLVRHYLAQVSQAGDDGWELPVFPEPEIKVLLDNTWGDTAKALVANWLGLVYQLTNLERTKQFMDGVDPNDPLGLKST